MKKQAYALLATGLLIASSAVFAQTGEDDTTSNQTTEVQPEGGLNNLGGAALGTAVVGGAVAAANDDSGDGSTGTTGTTGTN